MTFPTVVFGSYEIGVGYTDGASIPTGGLRVFLVPTLNIGPVPMDIGITYIDQFGISKTTTVTTSIPAVATSGTHYQIVLNSGDTGIRDVTNVSIIGGSTGDKFNLESWNEGLGREAFSIIKSEPNPEWTPSEPIKEGLFLKELIFVSTFPYPYLSANPIIPTPISFTKLCPRMTPGYPEPPLGCTGGEYLPYIISGNEHIPKTYSYISLCPRTTPGYPEPPSGCIGSSFLETPLSGRQLTARRFAILKTWLESVVGQVVSGYVQNISGETITNAFSMILLSPTGSPIVTNVNPDTGLYQAFFKSVIYDKRYIIIKIGMKNIALEGSGTPPFIDGNQQLLNPFNLQFACPIIDCDFNITRNI